MRKLLAVIVIGVLAFDPISHPSVPQIFAQVAASVLALSYLLPFAWTGVCYLWSSKYASARHV